MQPFYGVSPNTIVELGLGIVTGFPGSLVRIVAGRQIRRQPALAEYYELPMKDGQPVAAYSPRGRVDRNGVVWTAPPVVTSRELRPPPVQCRRSMGRKRPVSTAPKALRRIRCGPRTTRARGVGQRRLAVLHVRRIASTCSAPQQQRADGDGMIGSAVALVN